ncbi:MAG: hypothetical protein ACR2P6_05550 [Gammaproteobacteria bacterium]
MTNDQPTAVAMNYGIRVSLPPDDPFADLVGTDWQKEHWFDTAAKRDAALQEMSKEHLYSRDGDKPALVFTAIDG